MDKADANLADCLEILQNLTYLVRTECTCSNAQGVAAYLDVIDSQIERMSRTLRGGSLATQGVHGLIKDSGARFS